MSTSHTNRTVHETVVHAPPRRVFGFIERVSDWATVFPPTVHVACLDRSDDWERIRIWAGANGQVRSWISRREVDRQAMRIRFRQEVSSPPVRGMAGEWIIESAGPDVTHVRLTHDFEAIRDDAESLAWIERAVDTNSRSELAALREAAEAPDELFLAFEDVVRVDATAGEVYAFLRDAAQWPSRVPHVSRVVLTEPDQDVQLLEMDTRSPDGSTHTTVSVRVCLPSGRLVYKQTRSPRLMAAHAGSWLVTADRTGTMVTAAHQVRLSITAVAEAFGDKPGYDEIRRRIREALGANSAATIRSIGRHTSGASVAVG